MNLSVRCKMVYEMSDKVMGNEIFNVFPQISTERLNLREIKQEDAESIYQLLSNPEVIKHDTFELFTTINKAEDMIKWFNNEFKQKRAIFWGISLKNESEIIGFVSVKLKFQK